MELALAIRRLMRHKLLLAVGVALAAAATMLALKPRTLHHSTARTQVLVDAPRSALADIQQSVTPLETLASTLANFAPSSAVLDLIGKHAGLSGDQLYAEGPVQLNVPRTIQEPTALQRNIQIAGETTPYRLEFNADPNLPEVGIYAQAPTTAQAVTLANAAVAGLTDYVVNLENAGNVPGARRVVIRQLGQATGSVDAPSASKTLAGLAFVGVLVLWCLLILVGERFVSAWRTSAIYAAPKGSRTMWRRKDQRQAHSGTQPPDGDVAASNGHGQNSDQARLAAHVGDSAKAAGPD
jgi:hypothetical protein